MAYRRNEKGGLYKIPRTHVEKCVVVGKGGNGPSQIARAEMLCHQSCELRYAGTLSPVEPTDAPGPHEMEPS